MRLWTCTTEKGFILARGVHDDEGIYMTWRADIGVMVQKLNNVNDAMNVAPTSNSVQYVDTINESLKERSTKYEPPKQGTSPSVCEILNRGD